jgi:hypothetical protein
VVRLMAAPTYSGFIVKTIFVVIRAGFVVILRMEDIDMIYGTYRFPGINRRWFSNYHHLITGCLAELSLAAHVYMFSNVYYSYTIIFCIVKPHVFKTAEVSGCLYAQ